MTHLPLQRTWIRILLTLLTAAMMVVIFFFSSQNAEKSDQTSGRVSKVIVKVVHPEYEKSTEEKKTEIFNGVQHAVRKTAHFSEYLALGVLLRLCLESWFGKRKFLFPAAWAGGTLYACTDELHQMLSDGRSAMWQDVLIDSSGVLTGVAVATLVLTLICRRLENKEQK